MTERAYTLKEVDQMRRAVFASRDSWEVHSNPEYQQQYERRRDREVEDQLRTYLLAGVDPQELEDKTAALQEAWKEAHEEAMFLIRLGRWLDDARDFINDPQT
jgi:hypothetical protein